MRKIFIIIPILTLLFGTSNVKAQSPIQIEGTTFYVNCNKQTMTAEICDNDYRIDDREFPIYMKTRHINGLPKTGLNKLNIPEKVKVDGEEYTITAIGRAAFAGYKNFNYVSIPVTVTSIGEYAFYRTQLMSVDIPASVTNIAKRAFGYCPLLQKINLPHEGVTMETTVYDGEVVVTTNIEGKPQRETATTAAPPVTADVDINIPTATKTNEETVVVIFANENYKNEAKARYAINDGRIFKKYCTETLGVPDRNIHIVENATLSDMQREINWLGRVVSAFEGDARIIVYYAGHGMPDEETGNAYLLPVDGVSTKVQTGYSLKTFYADLSEMSTQSVTLFMDACFCGALRGEGMLASSHDVTVATHEEQPVGNLVVFSATQKDEAALLYEEMGHGVFTYYLLKKLQETKGNVNYQELGTYLKKQVGRHAVLEKGTQQTPSMRAANAMNGKLMELKLN